MDKYIVMVYGIGLSEDDKKLKGILKIDTTRENAI